MGSQTVFNLPERRLLIGGDWKDAASGEVFPTINPATEDTIAYIAAADAVDIDAAVRAARHALEEGPWRLMTGAQRGRLLRRLADLIEQDRENLVSLEALDAGKPWRHRAGRTCPLQSIAWSITAAGRTRSRARSCPPARCAHLHHTPARRRGGCHRAVELPADECGVEDRSRSGLRVHCGLEAGGADPLSALRLGRAGA